MQRTTGMQLSEAGAAFMCGPAEGVNFFSPYGWEPKNVQGMLKTAARFKRSPAAAVLATRAQGEPRKLSMDRRVPAQQTLSSGEFVIMRISLLLNELQRAVRH